MSMSSSLFKQNNNDFSGDLDDLRQQNRYLYEQNLTLKKSLEELININTELTQSIQQFNTSHVENFPHINQQEIEQLALRVIELEQDLEKEKSEREKERIQGSQHHQSNNTVEETLKVIEELVNSFRSMQEQYQRQLQRMQGQLQNQKGQWVHMSQAIEDKLIRFQEQYNKVIVEMRHSQGLIKAQEMELQERNRNNYNNKKEMKISTTIEDLRVTLERQIEEKDRIIRHYQHVLEGVKAQVSQKFAGI